MSALAIALASALATHQQQQQQQQQEQEQEQPPAPMATPPSPSSSMLSSSPSCSSLSSSSTSSTCSDASASSSRETRPNEHLAVLLPRQLWKADRLAAHCDNFYCRVPFSVFERRHHCRKCGGVFCAPCTSRNTPLLDASNLAFLHPPRNTPLEQFASPTSPLLPARVCDDCFDQIHGLPCRTPDVVPFPRAQPLSRTSTLLSSPISLFKLPRSLSGASTPISPDDDACSLSSSPVSCVSVSSPPSPTCGPATANLSRRSTCSSTRSTSNLARTRPPSLAGSPRLPPKQLAPERSYGELDAYPLKRASLLCKAAGGGRWEPTPLVVMAAERVPVIGGKAPYELEMEREEEEKRRRRMNPVVRDGDFQYRRNEPVEEEEPVLEFRGIKEMSTF
ncbi:FYVE-domain-containing protein [Mycena rebaudengoi]|nr:FYVE-domain-containing protein [Mycena rebaudengoi]